LIVIKIQSDYFRILEPTTSHLIKILLYRYQSFSIAGSKLLKEHFNFRKNVIGVFFSRYNFYSRSKKGCCCAHICFIFLLCFVVYGLI